MPAPVLILAGVGLLAAISLGIHVVLIIGIRRGDRSHLANEPGSRPEAFARRLLVDVRYHSEDNDGEDQ